MNYAFTKSDTAALQGISPSCGRTGYSPITKAQLKFSKLTNGCQEALQHLFFPNTWNVVLELEFVAEKISLISPFSLQWPNHLVKFTQLTMFLSVKQSCTCLLYSLLISRLMWPSITVYSIRILEQLYARLQVLFLNSS